MNPNDTNNESTAFFQTVFDDLKEDQFTHKIIVGDYNIVLNHAADTLGYLHINNPNSRDHLTRKIELCNMVDIWRLKNPNGKQYTFNKKPSQKLY